ncbi:hypothetical protein Q2941_50900 [Bradyrhizobium sp. UFLA05-153]
MPHQDGHARQSNDDDRYEEPATVAWSSELRWPLWVVPIPMQLSEQLFLSAIWQDPAPLPQHGTQPQHGTPLPRDAATAWLDPSHTIPRSQFHFASALRRFSVWKSITPSELGSPAGFACLKDQEAEVLRLLIKLAVLATLLTVLIAPPVINPVSYTHLTLPTILRV